MAFVLALVPLTVIPWLAATAGAFSTLFKLPLFIALVPLPVFPCMAAAAGAVSTFITLGWLAPAAPGTVSTFITLAKSRNLLTLPPASSENPCVIKVHNIFGLCH